jgi:predicted kinase
MWNMANLYTPAPFRGYPYRRPDLYVTVGPPAAGKTTWAQRVVAAAPERRARVNRDLVREINGCIPIGNDAQEGIVTIGCTALARTYLRAGIDVVVDDTCSHPATLTTWVSLALRFDVSLTVVDFTTVPVATCISRDRARGLAGDRCVGHEVIEAKAEACAAVMREVPSSVAVVMPR